MRQPVHRSRPEKRESERLNPNRISVLRDRFVKTFSNLHIL